MKRSNWVIYLLIILAAGAFMSLFIILFSNGAFAVLLPIVILNCVFLFSIVCYHRIIYSGRMKSNVDIMRNTLEGIISDPLTETPRIVSDDAGISYFYEELDKIKSKLRDNDESRQEILAIINSVAVNVEFDKLLDDLIPKLLTVTNSTCCAFYVTNPATGKLELKQSLGFSKNIYSEFDVSIGEGLIGMAAAKRQTVVYNDIPDDSVYLIRTFLGKMKPKGLLVLPIINQEQLAGVLVFASIYSYPQEKLNMVETIKYYMGIAVNNGASFERNKRLTNELKFQNKLIQNLNEELEKNAHERTIFHNEIIDSVEDYAIYAMDKEGKIQLWNRGAELLFGIGADEVIGKPVSTIYTDSKEAGLVASRIDSTLHNGRYTENGWRYKKDGSKYYYEMHMFAMYNDRKDVIGLTNITRDITAVKNLENELFVEKETVNRLFSFFSDARVIISADGTLLFANDGARRLLEIKRDAEVNKYHISDFFPDFNEDFNKSSGKTSGNIQSLRKNSREPFDISFETLPGEKVRMLLILTEEETAF